MQAGRRVRFTLRVFDSAGRKAERGGERVSGRLVREMISDEQVHVIPDPHPTLTQPEPEPEPEPEP